MKKILFFAGLLAFVTSCTDEELYTSGSAVNNELPNGISFSGIVADATGSRGELGYDGENKFPFFWYAEQDEINVYPFGEVTTKSNLDDASTPPGDTIYVNTHDNWAKLTTAPRHVLYKATKSDNNGQFTAKDATNMLVFADSTAANKKLAEGTIAATYNATVTCATFDKNHLIDTLTIKVTTPSNTQNYDGDMNVTHYMPMYAVGEAKQKEEYNSVGEKAELSFLRYGAIAGFRSEGIDETYAKLFGKLKTITLSMKGDKNDTIAASNIAIKDDGNATYTIVVADPVGFGENKTTIEAVNADSTIVATYNKTWADGDVAYMALMPVDRAAFAKAAGGVEYYNIKYEFENITFNKDSLTTKNNWASKSNGVLNMPELKMTDYGHLVLTDGATRSLIVNSGSFDAIFTDTAATTIKVFNTLSSDIDTLICKVDLTADQQKKLAKFTGLKHIELTEVTSLAKGALAAQDLNYISMPKVTSIAKEFSSKTITPATVLLPAYKFDVKEVNDALITVDLKKLDMSAVEKLEETFYAPCALSFTAATSLEEVKVKDNLKVEVPNLFKGCRNLAKVDGIIDITYAPGIFQNVDSLVTVNITGTVIPEAAFCTNGSVTKLANVLVDSVQVVPTAIGVNAFYGCKALTTMDLKNTTTIGDYAFSLSGLTKPSKDVTLMTVGATTIGKLAFSGTKLTQVDFVNATSIDEGIFRGVTTIGAVQFQKPFIVNETINRTYDNWSTDTPEVTQGWDPDTFGSTTTLYVANGQKYVEGNTLKLPYVVGTGTTATTVYSTFYFTTIKVAAAQ